MIRLPWRSPSPSEREAPSTVAAGERIYAIGDIHGRLDLLDKLLARIEEDSQARGSALVKLIFLGDLIDRGPDSAGVVERLRLLAASRPANTIRFVIGNHEEVFLGALAGDAEAFRFFHRIGGRETALSYGIPAEDYHHLDTETLVKRLVEAVPQAHVDFLRGFEDMVIIGDYAFVHAGIRPDRPLADQKIRDLHWIRESFLRSEGPFEKVVVHGHSISHDAELLPYRIGIDTGAYATGRLSAVGLEGTERWIVQARD